MIDSEIPVCLCQIPANLQRSQIYESIASYVRNIPKEQQIEDAAYEKRLAVCSECEALVNGLTCRYCGCFVLARARKRSQSCPMPGGDLWNSTE